MTTKAVIYGSSIARRLRVGGVVNALAGFGYAYGAGQRRLLLRRALDIAFRSAFAPPNVRIIVQNAADQREVERLCPAARSRTRLIPGSGVDLEQFPATQEPGGVPVVVLPARLLRDKGVVEFAEAARTLQDEGLNARFLLAGRLDPENRSALTASEVAALCARTGVEWLGESRDMPGVLRQCNLVCLPSYYREGVPKALLEAAAAQRAVVTSRMPGCEDVVRDGYNGLTVPPRSVKPLADALRALLIDPELRARMAKNGRLRAEAEFGIQTVVERHLAIYSELLTGLPT